VLNGVFKLIHIKVCFRFLRMTQGASIRQSPYAVFTAPYFLYISWSGLHWLPVKWCIDVPLFPMPFVVPFELNMFVPFELDLTKMAKYPVKSTSQSTTVEWNAPSH